MIKMMKNLSIILILLFTLNNNVSSGVLMKEREILVKFFPELIKHRNDFISYMINNEYVDCSEYLKKIDTEKNLKDILQMYLNNIDTNVHRWVSSSGCDLLYKEGTILYTLSESNFYSKYNFLSTFYFEGDSSKKGKPFKLLDIMDSEFKLLDEKTLHFYSILEDFLTQIFHNPDDFMDIMENNEYIDCDSIIQYLKYGNSPVKNFNNFEKFLFSESDSIKLKRSLDGFIDIEMGSIFESKRRCMEGFQILVYKKRGVVPFDFGFKTKSDKKIWYFDALIPYIFKNTGKLITSIWNKNDEKEKIFQLIDIGIFDRERDDDGVY
jgi:hypothetical protein